MRCASIATRTSRRTAASIGCAATSASALGEALAAAAKPQKAKLPKGVSKALAQLGTATEGVAAALRDRVSAEDADGPAMRELDRRLDACWSALHDFLSAFSKVPDVPEALRRAFTDAAAAADVIITSGGVSVGEADFVKQLMDELGEVLFWKIAMKPGRPLAYGRIGSAHFFGLPGNPVAVMVTFYEFVQNALKILQGRQDIGLPPTFKVPLSVPIRRSPGRTD